MLKALRMVKPSGAHGSTPSGAWNSSHILVGPAHRDMGRGRWRQQQESVLKTQHAGAADEPMLPSTVGSAVRGFERPQ